MRRWVAEQLREVGYETSTSSPGPGRGNVFACLAGAIPVAVRCWSTGISTWCPQSRRTGACTRSPGRSPTATCQGPRRGRHEGHVRDDDRRRPALQTRASSRRAIWYSPSSPTREAGGKYGARWLVENRPDLFDGITEAVGEVGGFAHGAAPRRRERRLHLIETAEKGMLWMRLKARGRAGHGSFIHDDNAVTTIADAVARLGRHQFPIVVHPRSTEFSPRSPGETGYTFDLDSPRPRRRDRQAGLDRADRRRHLRDTANPTMPQGRLQGQRDTGDR